MHSQRSSLHTFCIALVLFLLSAVREPTQYYVDLGDNTGYDVAQSYATLNAAAQELVEAFPPAYQDSFRVYSTGFYVHAGDFDGGYPLAFSRRSRRRQRRVSINLLIGRESDEIGLYRR